MEAQPPLQKPPGYRDPTIPLHIPPPRKPNLPPSFYPRKKSRSCCCTCCCCVCILIVLVVLFSLFAGGLLYLWYRPRLPVFHVKSLQMHKFNVTDGPDGMVLDAQTAVSVEVENPNSQLKIVYDQTRVYLSGEDDLNLGFTSFPGFTQEKHNVKVLKFKTLVKNMLVDDLVGKKLKYGFRSKNLMVSTKVRTGVGFRGSGRTGGPVPVKVICGATSLKLIGNGAIPKCHINVFKWINLY